MENAHSSNGALSAIQASIWELPDGQQRVDGLDDQGAPDPLYAAALGLKASPLTYRAAAASIDIGFFAVLQVPFIFLALPLVERWLTGRISWYGFVNHPDFVLAIVGTAISVSLTSALVVAQLATQGRAGFTLGKLATGLRVVNVRTLARPGIWRVTLRALVTWCSVVTVVGPILFLTSPWFGRRNRARGWHDRIGSTWVITIRQGLNPYDKKRMRIARKAVISTPTKHARALPSLATADDGGQQDYRPGERSSAGVLGVARPHRANTRVSVGLTGPKQIGPPPVAPTEGAGGPELGGYLRSSTSVAPSRQQPDSESLRRTGKQQFERPNEDAPSSAGPSEPVFTLLFDTGVQIGLTKATVLGRSPKVVNEAHPVAIADPSRSISSTHVLLIPAGFGVEVIDQGSRNGTAIVSGGQRRTLTAGQVGLAMPGDTIRFGDRAARVMDR